MTRDAIGEARGERQVVHDGEDGVAIARSVAQELHHDKLVPRIECGRRLVRKKHWRLRGEGAGQRHARLLAA